MKRYFIIGFLIISTSSNVYANLYFSNAKKEDIGFALSPVEKVRWHGSESVYRVWKEQGRKRWEKVDGGSSYSLKHTESLFLQVPGLSLVRISFLEAFEDLGVSVLEDIGIYQIYGTTGSLPFDANIDRWTKVKIVPILDESGAIYIRAPMGSMITYEITHRSQDALKISCSEMEYLSMNFFWEHFERTAMKKLSDEADEFLEYLTALAEKNMERSFIEKQLVALPWLPRSSMTSAERQYRLSRLFYDILYARRRDGSVFTEKTLQPTEGGRAYEVGGETFYEIKPSNTISFGLTGPELLKIETRFVYPSRITDEVQPYTLFCYEDGLLRKVIYKSTVLDDLEGIVLDSDGRPVGRRRVDYLAVPPGRHEYRLTSGYHLLATFRGHRKKLHVVDALTETENSDRWVKGALRDAENMLQRRPDDLKLLYLKGCCLYLMNRYKAALAVYRGLSAREEELNSKGEFLMLAGVHLHLAKLYEALERYSGAFDSLSFALKYCEKAILQPDSAILANTMIKSVYRQKANLLRKIGKHSEAADEYRLILQQSPMDVAARFARAETLAWIQDLAALEEYDKVVQLNPRDVIASNTRQRFWRDNTYWRTLYPSSKQCGKSRRMLDSSEVKWNADWAAAGIIITDDRGLPGYCEIPPDIPTEIELGASVGESGRLKIICYANAKTPWLLEVDIGEELRVKLPIVRERSEFELPVAPGTHRVLFITPRPSLVDKILINARLSDVNGIQKRWHERVYLPIPRRDQGVGDAPQVLEYHTDPSAATYIRGFVHVSDGTKEESQEAVTLVIYIDDSIYTEVVLEEMVEHITFGGRPYEFVLPIPAGQHTVGIWQKEGNAEAVLHLSYREIRKKKQISAFFLPQCEVGPPAAAPLPVQGSAGTDPASTAYLQGYEILNFTLKDGQDNTQQRLLDAIKLFTTASYLAKESDSVKYQAYIGRANALRKLERFDLALSDCLKVIDSSLAAQSLVNQARTQLADIYLDMGGKVNSSKALDEYARLLRDGVDNVHIRSKLGRIYQTEGNSEAAMAQYDSVLETHPYHQETLLNRAIIEVLDRRLAAAAATLDNLLNIFVKPPNDLLWQNDRLIASKAQYLRGKVAFLLGDFVTARRHLEHLCNAREAGIAFVSLRSQGEWELSRISAAESILNSFKNALPPGDLIDLYYQIAEFNAAWLESPKLSTVSENSKLFGENWGYLGDGNIIDYTAKTRAVVESSGVDLGDHFLISDESYVVLRVEGPTLLSLDVRPAHIYSDPDREIVAGLDIDVQIEESGERALTWSIRNNQPSVEVVYPLINVLPGRRERIIRRIGAGVHDLKVRTTSGIAHIRPYVLRPSPEAYFIMVEDNLPRVEQSRNRNSFSASSGFWYGRALAESYRLPDTPENLYMRAKCLLALNLDAERALEMLRRVLEGRDTDETEHELGQLYLSKGRYDQALPYFDRVFKTDAESLRKNARLHRIRAMIRSALGAEELEKVVQEYDAYCITYPDDIRAKLEFASFCLSLGDKMSDIALNTYWYNKALNIYATIIQTNPELEEAAKGLTFAKSKTQWQRIRTVENAAGHEDVASMISEISGFSLRLIEAMTLPIWKEGTYTSIGVGNDAVFSISLSHPIRIAVQFFGQMLATTDKTEEQEGYHITYLQNGSHRKLIEGNFDEVISCEVGALPTGQHILRFSLDNAKDEEIVMVRLLGDRNLTGQTDYRLAETDTQTNTRYADWYVVEPISVRKYFIATRKTPVQTLLQGPTQLRLIVRYLFDGTTLDPSEERSFKVLIKAKAGKISEYSHHSTAEVSKTAWLRKGNSYESKDRGVVVGKISEIIIPIAEGPCEIIVSPDSEDVRLAVRMYARVSEKAGTGIQSPQFIMEEKAALHDSEITQRKPDLLPIYWEESPLAKPIPPLQKYGSAEIVLGYGGDFDDETAGQRLNYVELVAKHRYRFEPNRLYHRGTLAMQLYDVREPVYRVEEFIYYRSRSPLKVISRSRLAGFLQSVSGKLETTVEFRTEIVKNFRVTSDLTYIPKIGYAYRWQSLDNIGNIDRDSLPKDIFSIYYKQHDRQVFLENTLWYKPFLDLIVYGKGRVKTNRDLNPVHPDYYYGRWGLKKLWVSRLESHIYHEVRKWLADEDRGEGRWENRLYVNLEYGWWRSGTRLIFRITNRYSIEEKENFLYVGFGSEFSANRMLRDYNPSEIDFEEEKSYFSQ